VILLQGFYYFNFSWLHQLLALIWYRKHAESDDSVPDAANKAETFAQRWVSYYLPMRGLLHDKDLYIFFQ